MPYARILFADLTSGKISFRRFASALVVKPNFVIGRKEVLWMKRSAS